MALSAFFFLLILEVKYNWDIFHEIPPKKKKIIQIIELMNRKGKSTVRKRG